MERKIIAYTLIILGLFPAMAFSTSFDRIFTHTYSGIQNAYVHTDIDTSPTLSLPGGKTIYCVGDTFTPTIGVSSDWYSSTYDAQLANQNNFGGCLNASCTSHMNNGLNWVNNSQYQALSYPVWYTSVSSFLSMISANNIPNNMPGECSKYLDGSYNPYNVNGVTLFKSDIGAYCKGNLSLISSNSAYSRTIAPEYIGSVPTIYPPIILNTASPSVSFTTRLNTTGCIMSGRTYATSDCQEVVYLYYNQSGGFPLYADSSTATITVKYPFTCSAVQFAGATISPNPVQPSGTLSFSFVVTNPPTNGEPALITGATASWAGGPPTITGAPVSVPNNGVPVAVSGTMASPSTPGIYTFNLNVSYRSATADCSGAVKNCSYLIPYTVNVSYNNTTPTSCTLAFSGGHPSTFTAPDSATTVATCRASDNSVVPCGYLLWTHSVTGGSVSPVTTNTPPNPSQTLFSINAVHQPQTNANVLAMQPGNFSCPIYFNVTAPDYISEILAPANYAQYQVGTPFSISVRTKNLATASASDRATITRLQFNGITTNFNVPALGQNGIAINNTTFTCPTTHALYLLTSQADSTFQLAEISETNNNDSKWINCTPNVPTQKPDYITSIGTPSAVTVGVPFTVTINTTNIGNNATSIISQTNFTKTGGAAVTGVTHCTGISGLGIGATNTCTRTLNCTAAGTFTLNSYADGTFLINELDETNNNDTATVQCLPVGNLPNYVPIISAPAAVFVGVPFTASFTTRNIGAAASTATSITRASFMFTIKDFSVPPIGIGGQRINSSSFNCSSPGLKSMAETVDITGVIDESSEGDNAQTMQIACYPKPTNCSLAFVDHPPEFYSPDSALVRATCNAGMLQTACPPFLWQQTAVNGSMSPINTNASMAPTSTLSIASSAPTPQPGRKVSATSTLTGVPLYCERPFVVTDGSPIGPDYTVTSVHPNPPTTLLGNTVHFIVNVTNIGNQNATNSSTVEAIYSSGCVPVKSIYPLPALNAGASNLNAELGCTCVSPGQQSITVVANPHQSQWETNFLNNVRSVTFICQTVAQLTCSDFI